MWKQMLSVYRLYARTLHRVGLGLHLLRADLLSFQNRMTYIDSNQFWIIERIHVNVHIEILKTKSFMDEKVKKIAHPLVNF